MNTGLHAKIYWEDKDLVHLSSKLTAGNRTLSLAMASLPQSAGDAHSTTYTCNSPSLALFLDGENVTYTVLGSMEGGADDVPVAIMWLMEGM